MTFNNRYWKYDTKIYTKCAWIFVTNPEIIVMFDWGIDIRGKVSIIKYMNNYSYDRLKRTRYYKGEHDMKKVYDLRDLDCANCAAKMEAAINKLDGVNSATVSFMTQKLTIDADDSRFDKIMKQVVKTISNVEPDCEVIM